MLLSRQPVALPTIRNVDLDELAGVVKRPGPALHVKVDGHRIVERRATELRRLQRQFTGVVTRTARFQDDSLEAWRSESYVPARQRWCPRLERDVRAVCSEAGLSAAAASAVIDASRRGLVSQNPGVLLSRLLRFQDCLSQSLGRRGVLCVLRTAPSLLRYSPDSLGWNAEMLAALLPDGDAVAAAVRKAPMLLGASAITIWGNFEGLRRLLRLDHDAALRLVVRAPRLLLNSRGALEGRLEGLMLLAGGGATRRRVVAAVARQPALLGYFPGTLERNLRAAAAVLGVPFSRVQPLLLKQPALVMLARESLRQRVVQLRDAAGLHDAADLAAVVLRQPSLLTLSPETVRRKVDVVARVLGLEGRPEELRVVLRGAPQLLTLAADSIRGKAEMLREAAAPCAALATQLERAPPQTVAVWLCMSSRRYEHVRAVAMAEAEGRVGPAAAAAAAAGSEAGSRRLEPRVQSEGESALEEGVGAGAGRRVSADASGAAAAAAAAAAGSSGAGCGAPTGRRRGRPRRVPCGDSPEGPQPPAQRAQEEVAAAGAAAGAAVEAEGGEAAAERAGPRRPRLSLYALLRDAASADADPLAAAKASAATSHAAVIAAAAAAAAAAPQPAAPADAAQGSGVAAPVAEAAVHGTRPGRRKGAATAAAAAMAAAGEGAAAGSRVAPAAGDVREAAVDSGLGTAPGVVGLQPRRRLRLQRTLREALGL
ncbi:hypothetical protein PLESTB_001604700 [Pleodorina starrii]|uniref:Uncharacterized protein n=1 Tax=Pleodorina starrii TaxID=330485 RepID=A0A9W6BY33_9CHLO|nr:hypothetical protein PLESTM_000175500 [Pleodorina starrii]GLC60368.1 hypothetical protein PLESTB_001604700 [Pleodorina starrii]GLC69387.1 hypothetical protein PLESTF_000824400 [Pleodorina starrii]